LKYGSEEVVLFVHGKGKETATASEFEEGTGILEEVKRYLDFGEQFLVPRKIITVL
jgi:hypothetical protein